MYMVCHAYFILYMCWLLETVTFYLLLLFLNFVDVEQFADMLLSLLWLASLTFSFVANLSVNS